MEKMKATIKQTVNGQWLIALLVLCTLHFSLFTRSASAQRIDPRVQKLLDEVKDMGFFVQYIISHDWQETVRADILLSNELLKKNNDAMEKIRSTMDEISHTAYKSYHYESHRDGNDTIDYAIMFHESPQNKTREIQGFTSWDSPEILTLQMGRFGSPYSMLIYHNQVTDTLSTEEPFDIKGFRKLITPIMKGHKRYKVLFSHDKEWSSNPENQQKTRRVTSFSGTDNDLSGTIKGYVYHIKGEEGKAAIIQIHETILRYLNQHPNQCYEYAYEERNMQLLHNMHYSSYPLTFQSLDVDESMAKSENIYIDIYSSPLSDDTFILVANSYGDEWIPMDWHKLSKEVNGVQTPNRKLQ